MGSKDSSKTRVAPTFDFLLQADPSGNSWLDRLLALGSRPQSVTSLTKGQRLIAGHDRRWGTDERGLPSPLALLEHLVRNLDPALVAKSSDTGTSLLKRRALGASDPRAIGDAIGQLRAGKRGRRWFVLEGESRPDALLETENLVVCIEGKRTEATCTSTTTWMKCRSQLLRHMDAATDQFRSKRVVGLLIVEGDGDAVAMHPSEHWKAECAAQYAPSMLADSLPHRTSEERTIIGENILGVTTWQAVCATFDIPWPPAPDIL